MILYLKFEKREFKQDRMSISIHFSFFYATSGSMKQSFESSRVSPRRGLRPEGGRKNLLVFNRTSNFNNPTAKSLKLLWTALSKLSQPNYFSFLLRVLALLDVKFVLLSARSFGRDGKRSLEV